MSSSVASRIRPLTRLEFDAVAQRDAYYKETRWTYMSVAGDIAADLIDRHGLRSALELGPYLRPLIVGADVMDRTAWEGLELEPGANLVLHSAKVTPWPVEDKQYDLFVALQVFEHLGQRQTQAFRQVCRVASHAIISLPINWETNPGDCHHGISLEKALRWFASRPPTRIVTGTRRPRKRVICVFENLEAF